MESLGIKKELNLM